MRANFVGGTSTTGGTGALTLAAADGFALPSAAFLDGSTVEYAINQYTDNTYATLLRAESGFGVVSANVLTRSAPRATWDGTTYSQSTAAALNFGTTNIRVSVTPLAEGGPTAYPARANFSDVYGSGPDGFCTGANFVNTFDFSAATLAANMLYMTPVRIEAGFPIKSLGVNVTTAAAGKLMSVCIAAVDPVTGLLGAVLLAANNLSVAATGIVSATVPGRILAPGWYWMCLVTDGAPSIMGSDTVVPSAMGMQGLRAARFVSRARNFGNFTVGAAAMIGASGSPTGVANAAAPILVWK